MNVASASPWSPRALVVAVALLGGGGCGGGAGGGVVPHEAAPASGGRPIVATPIPVSGPSDRDSDGVVDRDDLCPDAPEDKDGFEDEDGCPDPDNDKDGILDVDDKCPNEPETYNGHQDEDGCPDQKLVVIHHPPPSVELVLFDVGAAALKKEAVPVLDTVVAVMKAHPQIVLLQLEGHADDALKPDAQLKLSRARAEAVRTYLVDHGIAATHLRTIGFGTYCPRSSEDKSRNRRVEFKLVKTTKGPSAVELGCAAATAAGIVSDPVPP